MGLTASRGENSEEEITSFNRGVASRGEIMTRKGILLCAQRATESPIFSENSPSLPSFLFSENLRFFAEKWFYLLKSATFFLKSVILSY